MQNATSYMDCHSMITKQHNTHKLAHEERVYVAYQEKYSPFGQNFNIYKISNHTKLIKYNPSKEETKYLKTTTIRSDF